MRHLFRFILHVFSNVYETTADRTDHNQTMTSDTRETCIAQSQCRRCDYNISEGPSMQQTSRLSLISIPSWNSMLFTVGHVSLVSTVRQAQQVRVWWGRGLVARRFTSNNDAPAVSLKLNVWRTQDPRRASTVPSILSTCRADTCRRRHVEGIFLQVKRAFYTCRMFLSTCRRSPSTCTVFLLHVERFCRQKIGPGDMYKEVEHVLLLSNSYHCWNAVAKWLSG